MFAPTFLLLFWIFSNTNAVKISTKWLLTLEGRRSASLTLLVIDTFWQNLWKAPPFFCKLSAFILMPSACLHSGITPKTLNPLLQLLNWFEVCSQTQCLLPFLLSSCDSAIREQQLCNIYRTQLNTNSRVIEIKYQIIKQ